MNTLITKSIGAGNGASQSALDVLLALQQASGNMNVISQKRIDLPAELDGFPLNTIKVYKSPKYKSDAANSMSNTFSSFFADFPPGISLNNIRLRKIRKINTKLVFVNSFSAHQLWTPIYNSLHWRGVLIIRESPRHQMYVKSSFVRNEPWTQFSRYEKFIFVSSNVMREWIADYPELNGISTYIPNCAHEIEIKTLKQIDKQKIRLQVGLKNKNFNVVCVANVIPRKGQDILIDAMPQLVQEMPNIRLVLVGSTHGAFAKNLVHRCRKSSFRNNIIFAGSRNDALKFIAAADVMVLASRAEALPRVILEAMALGIPVISTAVDGVPELIDDDESGILFTPDDPVKMVAGFRRIYQDPQIGLKLAQKAEHKYWSHFSRELQIRRYKKFLIDEQ